MNDQKKTKAQLIDDLTTLRQRVAEMEQTAGKFQPQQDMLVTVFENAGWRTLTGRA